MKKPEALEQLLEELGTEKIESTVETVRESKAVVYMNDEAASSEDGIRLSKQDCMLLFASISTINRFFEALGDVDEASITLFDIMMPNDVLDSLETHFVAVDEG
jgi:hypothetical protein